MNTVLFDLDGTLLPMDQEEFVNAYIEEITGTFRKRGMDPEKLAKALWAGTEAMVKNDGSASNEEVFWKVFADYLGEEILERKPEFDRFYREEFRNVSRVASANPTAAACIRELKEKGYLLVAATNPLFPDTATRERIRWAGLNPEDFELITTYENSLFCKPNLDYYRAILAEIGKEAEECLMVGNDVGEDMCARNIGMEIFLLTDHKISREDVDEDQFPQGDFEKLYSYVKSLPPAKTRDELLVERAEKDGFCKAAVISVEDLTFSPSFRQFCEMNLCGQYGKNYSCPPDCGSPADMEAKAKTYRKALVLQSMFDGDAMNDEETKALKREHNKRVRTFITGLKEEGMFGTTANAGPCSYCRECARIKEEPCRFPGEIASCLSAYCINAEKMAEHCGMEYWCPPTKVTFFGIYFMEC